MMMSSFWMAQRQLPLVEVLLVELEEGLPHLGRRPRESRGLVNYSTCMYITLHYNVQSDLGISKGTPIFCGGATIAARAKGAWLAKNPAKPTKSPDTFSMGLWK